jgi:hypothetical protein
MLVVDTYTNRTQDLVDVVVGEVQNSDSNRQREAIAINLVRSELWH